MTRLLGVAVLVAAMISATASPSSAGILMYNGFFSGAAEVPPNPSPGSGFVFVTIDTDLDTMTIHAEFKDLMGLQPQRTSMLRPFRA